jgi:two-component system phosphate regulon sensor histidine kinase PhoR
MVTRLFKHYVILILLLTVSLIILNGSLIHRFYLRVLTEDLTAFAHGLEPQITLMALKGDYRGLNLLVGHIGTTAKIRITIITDDGRVLADSSEDAEVMTDHWNRPEVIEALAGGVGTATRYSETVGEKMLYVTVARPLQPDRTIVIRTSVPLRTIHDFLYVVMRRILYVGAAVALLALLYAFYHSRRVSRPVMELVAATSRVAAGDLEAKVFLRDRGEMADLGRRFNEMTSSIKRLFEEDRRTKERLEQLITSMQDGLVVFDPDGKVSLANDSFKEIARTGELMGKSFWEIGSFRLVEFIEKARAEKRHITEELELNHRVFLMSATNLGESGELLVLAHDISGVRQVQEFKRDLVANVSHELRTPLTAVKGYLETLEEEQDPETKARYLTIVQRHVDRLANIVQDLLVLSELEAGETRLELEELDIATLLDNVRKLVRARAEEKGLTLDIVMRDSVSTIRGDPFKLEQLFFNLVDNAIKYTDDGRVTITVSRRNAGMQVTISDTGIGIPADDIPRIFERFYVVDKSRSRNLGGTGLGLSIVKHIVLLHGGTIQVDSTLGAGTTFMVLLPLLTKN